MITCKICLKKFKSLRFQSSRVCICGRCTNDLNNYKEGAKESYKAARELLLNGMLRRATIDASSPSTPRWKQEKAARILENIETEVDRALPKWINKLVADKSNRTKIFKIIRAHRRGLLHRKVPDRCCYPNNWDEIAHNIRKLDNFTCVSCSKTGVELHVHHVVYASNFGTHRKTNLITLCRACHEKEHKRVFDFGEKMDVTSETPSSGIDCASHLLHTSGIMRFDVKVEDREGSPISGAFIQISCDILGCLLEEEADTKGLASFELDSGHLDSIRILAYCNGARQGTFVISDGDELLFR